MFFGFVKTLIPVKSIRHLSHVAVEYSYRATAWLNSIWMLKVVGLQIDVDGDLPDHPAPIVISNHQSWMDIPVLHHVITGQGPILKFLIKRQLIWVPVIGWILYALNFPRLHRGAGDGARKKDFDAIASFTSSLTSEGGALMIFAEGTRFTEEKRLSQRSPYVHLLIPRPGGLKITLDAVGPDTPIVDATIIYHGDTNFWHCLHGSTKHISVVFKTYQAAEVQDVREWLTERWREKEALFETWPR